MSLKLSEIESNIFNCKIARFETDLLNSNNFQNQLIENNIDICRLKLNGAGVENYEALSKLNMPFQFCGSILKYKMDFFNLPKPSYKNSGLQFEIYNPTHQKEILKNLIEETFIKDPIGYYKNNLLAKIFTKQQEVECMSRWYVQNCNIENNKMILMKQQENYIGYISIFKTNDNMVDTPVAGVLPKFQGQNMFDDLRSYRFLYCLENDIQFGTAGARIENNYSQQTFINDGMKQIGNEAIYIVTPFLNNEAEKFSCTTNEVLSPKKCIQIVNEKFDQKQLNCNELKYSSKSYSVSNGEISKCTISIPVNAKDKSLFVLKYFNADDQLCVTNWFEFES